jgi:hypothetical protein
MAAVAEVVQHQQHEVVLGKQPRLLYELLIAPVQLVFVVSGMHDHVADSAGNHRAGLPVRRLPLSRGMQARQQTLLDSLLNACLTKNLRKLLVGL